MNLLCSTERKRMECLCLCNSIPPILPFRKTVAFHNGHNFPSNLKNPKLLCPSLSTSKYTANCRERTGEEYATLSCISAYAVLGVDPDCSAAELKAAFRDKVKQFHPDVNRDGADSDTMIRRVIQAYEMLSNQSRSEIIESECLDPFEKPECEAFDLFVNEVVCVGKGHGDDYQVHLALGQCPRSCIYYVTPSQRIILEELLDSILSVPYDTSAEAELLYSLIVKAKFENNRFQRPKKQPKTSTKHVDWF